MNKTSSIYILMNTILLLEQLRKEKDVDFYYIDLFCGAGGTSTGVELAEIDGKKIARVIACVNHDKNAIASHMANHPYALHFTEDMRTINLSPIVNLVKKIRLINPGAKIVLWASLECTNFSKAKGGQARDADSRTLADHLFRYILEIDPDYIQIENVEEFMCWGDLDENGKPLSKDKGLKYLQWVDRVQYGYGRYAKHMHPDVYNDWYRDMRRKGSMEKRYEFDHRILNAADFGAYTSRKRFFGQFAKHGLPISWPEPTHCKDGRQDMFSSLKKWRAVKDVLDFSDEGNTIFREKPLSEKTLERIYAGLIKFVAGGKDSFMVKYNSMNRAGKYQAPSMDEPCPTVSTQGRLAVAQVSFLSKQFSGHPESKNISLEEPAGAITCRDHHAFVQAYYGGANHNYSIDSPSPSLTTKDRLAIISSYYGNGGNSSVNSPAPTVTTKDRFSLLQPQFIDQQYGQGRPASTDSPLGCITTTPKYNLVSCKPWIMNTNFGNVGSSIDQPAQTVTANRKWHYLMNPQFNSAGGSVDLPCFTLIARMDKMPPYLIATETGQMAIEIYETDSPMAVKIKEFMAMYGIVDIKMRMLRIPELKRIMGFPEDYVLIGSQADQKKFIGNAVEVNMARVLCETSCRKIRELRTVA